MGDFEARGLVPLTFVVRPAIESARVELDRHLAAVAAALDDLATQQGAEAAKRAWLESLARLGTRTQALRASLNGVSSAVGLPKGGKGRLLEYFRAHVGSPVHGRELAGVAGIGEWARRVRELREEGYRILSDEGRDDLVDGEYLLESADPETTVGNQWIRAGAIRSMDLAPRDKLVLFLKEHLGQRLFESQLRHASRVQNLGPSLRALRSAGWRIATHFEDATLSPGEYRPISTGSSAGAN